MCHLLAASKLGNPGSRASSLYNGGFPPDRKRLQVLDRKRIANVHYWVATVGISLCQCVFVGEREQDPGEISGKNITFRKYGVLVISCLFSAPFLPLHTLLCITGPRPLQTTDPRPPLQVQPRGSTGRKLDGGRK